MRELLAAFGAALPAYRFITVRLPAQLAVALVLPSWSLTTTATLT